MEWWKTQLAEYQKRLDHLKENSWRAPRQHQMKIRNEMRSLSREINLLEGIIENDKKLY